MTYWLMPLLFQLGQGSSISDGVAISLIKYLICG